MPEVEVYPGETETEIETESLVHLRLITHNARLVDVRKELGMLQPVMAQAVGVSQDRLRNIENLRAVPTEEEICRIACVLEKPIDYLFPEELLSAVKAGVFSRRKVELNAPQVISLTEAQRRGMLTYDGETEIIEGLDRKLLAERIHEVVGTLAPREQRVIRLRFGLDGEQPRTLEEVGREFGVTRERIRMMEAEALRRLRHPSRSRKLKDYLE